MSHCPKCVVYCGGVPFLEPLPLLKVAYRDPPRLKTRASTKIAGLESFSGPVLFGRRGSVKEEIVEEDV